MQRRAGLAIAASVLVGTAAALSGQTVPVYRVDPLWPKPLPNHWILGSVTGVAVDAQDHVWIVHRGAVSLNARTEMGLGTNPPTSDRKSVV